MRLSRKSIPVLIVVLFVLSAANVGCKTQSSTVSSAAISSYTYSSAPRAESSSSGTRVSVDVEVSSKQSEAASSESTGSEADPSCLDESVFIGDSVTLKLKNYIAIKRKKSSGFFGNARFLAAGSMGSGNALKPLGKDSIHPYYNGVKALLEDNTAKMGVNKIFIMLGMNDVAIYGIDGAAKNLETLTLKIREKNPGVQVYIQSVTPILKSKEKRMLNNKNLELYNKKLEDICKRQKWNFIDVASAMRESDGSLKPEYCSDPDDLGIHFTDKACEVWIHCILTHIEL